MVKRNGCRSGFHKENGKCARDIPRANIQRRDGLAGMPPMVARVGGKTKLKKKLVAHVPDHKTYVEPFMGGGTLYWQLPLAEDKTVINDMDPALVKFYRDVQKRPTSNLVGCRLPTTKKEFEAAKASARKDGTYGDACGYLKVIKRSYGAKGMIFNMPPIESRPNNQKFKSTARLTRVISNADMFQEKLNHTVIESDDFCTVMKKHDSKDAFHYLDPPYWDTHHKYGLPKVHPNDVAGCANQMKGKVLVSYDNAPEVRKAFNSGKWKKEKHDTKYEMQSSNRGMRGEKKDVTELMIRNYNPKTGESIKPRTAG
jgi:DNA adenine methylase